MEQHSFTGLLHHIFQFKDMQLVEKLKSILHVCKNYLGACTGTLE